MSLPTLSRYIATFIAGFIFATAITADAMSAEPGCTWEPVYICEIVPTGCLGHPGTVPEIVDWKCV